MADAPCDNLMRAWAGPDALSVRASDDGDGDGNTLFGHFAVFDRWTEIDSWYEGEFLERIAPGSFKRTIKERRDQIKVLYDHGFDPQIGNKPLGPIRTLREDDLGPFYEVPLIDTDYNRDFVKPALDAGLLGASFRFRVTAEEWVEPKKATKANPRKLRERTITDVDLYEFGPVTFPAYADASAGLRSHTDHFIDRLLNDPLFVVRLAERISPRAVEHILSTLPTRGGSDETSAPEDEPTRGRSAKHIQLRARARLILTGEPNVEEQARGAA